MQRKETILNEPELIPYAQFFNFRLTAP